MKRAAKGYIDPRRQHVITTILAALPGTQKEASVRTGIHRATISKVIGILHKSGQAHISSWNPHPVRGPSAPVYSAGFGEDAIDSRPRLTRKEISDRFDARIRGTEKFDIRRAKQRMVHWRRKAVAKQSTWASALFVGVRVPTMNVKG